MFYYDVYKSPFISPSIKNVNIHKNCTFFASSISCIIIAFIKVSKPGLTFYSYLPQRKVAPRIKYKSNRIHYTRANVKKKMKRLEQENKELREGMTAI